MADELNPQAELDKLITESSEEEVELSDFERLIQERYGSAPDEDESGPSASVEPEGEGELPAETPSPENETPTPTDIWDLGDGVQLTKQEALELIRINRVLAENPQVQEAIAAEIQKLATPEPPTEPPTPAATTPPPEIDLDDPVVKFLYEQNQALQQQVEQVKELTVQNNTQLTTQTEATTLSIVNRAVTSFQKEHALTDDQMSRIREVASTVNIDALLFPTNPITGAVQNVDPLDAVEKALDIAYWSIPEYREQEINRQLQANRQANEKKRKLSSLGGSGGSGPKEPPAPQTKEEIRLAMIKEVAANMGLPTN